MGNHSDYRCDDCNKWFDWVYDGNSKRLYINNGTKVVDLCHSCYDKRLVSSGYRIFCIKCNYYNALNFIPSLDGNLCNICYKEFVQTFKSIPLEKENTTSPIESGRFVDLS